jgi:hypothetical protein
MKIYLSYLQFKQSSRYNRVKGLLTKTHLSPKQVFTMIVEALDQAIGGMEPGLTYRTEDLFEPSVWAGMGDAISRSLGICLSYLVASTETPLVYANRPSSTNKLYSLKHGVDPGAYSFQVC